MLAMGIAVAAAGLSAAAVPRRELALPSYSSLIT
jgi:hypothetical protein